MLYLIRCAFACAAGSSDAYDGAEVSQLPPPNEAGVELLKMTRALFRELASSVAGGKERGFLLGTLEVAREARARGWNEGEYNLDQRERPAEQRSQELTLEFVPQSTLCRSLWWSTSSSSEPRCAASTTCTRTSRLQPLTSKLCCARRWRRWRPARRMGCVSPYDFRIAPCGVFLTPSLSMYRRSRRRSG